MVRTLLALSFVSSLALGQPPKQDPKKDPPRIDATPDHPPPKPAAPPGPPEFEITFADQSAVRAHLLDATVLVATKYGKLTIPIRDIKRIELGFRYPDGVEAKIGAAVNDLGANDFPVREAAEKTLLDLKAYAGPAVLKAMKSPDKEVAKRADGLAKRIAESASADRPEPKEFDTIETGEFTFQGKLETVVIRVKTKYFAESPLKIAELRAVKVVGHENTDTIAVDAAKYGRNNDHQTWLETTVEVVAGKPLDVTASGQIDLWPQQGGQYFVQPNGVPQHGSVQLISASNRGYQFVSGTLLGKIGPTGEPFVVGSNYKAARATQQGKLYLKIAGSPWGNVSQGSYQVKVKTGG
jgi:hypothetical protein